MIDTQIWKPNPDKPGYLKYYGQVEMMTITEGIRDALAAIPYEDGEYSALDVLEWINGPHNGWSDDQPDDALWPEKTEAMVTVKHGGSEGYHILILAMDRKGNAQQLYTIKYLLGRDEVWQIAAALDLAFEIH